MNDKAEASKTVKSEVPKTAEAEASQTVEGAVTSAMQVVEEEMVGCAPMPPMV